MPFDSMPVVPAVEVEDTPLARRRRLIAALRGEMPAGFTWNFNKTHFRNTCGTVGCAMGLAIEIGVLRPFAGMLFALDWYEPMAARIGISKEDSHRIFGMVSSYGANDPDKVTPAMVADKLEQLP